MGKRNPLFTKVLISNRGEIACRVIETLKKLGIVSIAVFHKSEASSRFVKLADEAYELDSDTPVSAYLDVNQIISVARKCGAEAIHPGYGFLSENSNFAKKVIEAGLVFVGPDPEIIELMGDKIRSREFARENGIPVAPSVTFNGNFDEFIAEASSIGFPLLIKASAGGGGKGMSIVEGPESLRDCARKAMAEAERYFADKSIYAELYVQRPRHIEVQVIGDGSGGAVHLFERECSIQRRFQKIVEEAPAAYLEENVREELCNSAIQLAKAANYKNAGTVEFILTQGGQFYFLEMNTRLQVEHPVTEMVTGVDLVELQLEVAAGYSLRICQEDIKLSGHAIECRICAEVPEKDFIPATGKVYHLERPYGDFVRFENGLDQGQAVTLNFDSMLAKLVVHGPDRSSATQRMKDALSGTVFLGVETNINYLKKVCSHPAFLNEILHTGFIEEHKAYLAEDDFEDVEKIDALLASALEFREFKTLAFGAPEPYATMGSWRN